MEIRKQTSYYGEWTPSSKLPQRNHGINLLLILYLLRVPRATYNIRTYVPGERNTLRYPTKQRRFNGVFGRVYTYSGNTRIPSGPLGVLGCLRKLWEYPGNYPSPGNTRLLSRASSAGNNIFWGYPGTYTRALGVPIPKLWGYPGTYPSSGSTPGTYPSSGGTYDENNQVGYPGTQECISPGSTRGLYPSLYRRINKTTRLGTRVFQSIYLSITTSLQRFNRVPLQLLLCFPLPINPAVIIIFSLYDLFGFSFAARLLHRSDSLYQVSKGVLSRVLYQVEYILSGTRVSKLIV